MNWTLLRVLTYLAMGAASLLALAGLADFNPATGDFDIGPFNLYAAVGAVAGVVSSALAAIAALRGWGRR